MKHLMIKYSFCLIYLFLFSIIKGKLEDILVLESKIRIDEEVRASGFSKDDDDVLLRFIHSNENDKSNDQDNENDDGDGSDDELSEDEEGNLEQRRINNRNTLKSISKVTDFFNNITTTTTHDNIFDFDNNDEKNENGLDKPVLSEFPKNPSTLYVDNYDEPNNNNNNSNIDNNFMNNIENDNDNDFLNSDNIDNISLTNTEIVLSEDALQKVKDKTRKYVIILDYLMYCCEII